MNVLAIFKDSKMVITEEGHRLPVTDYFDKFGRPCDHVKAVMAVAGADGIGWLSLDVSEYPFVYAN